MTTGGIVLIVVVAFVGVFGGWRLFSDGRFQVIRRADEDPRIGGRQAAPAEAPSLLAQTRWSDALGERATLLQFSSAFCAPCRSTRRILDEVASAVPGVSHIEVDAEQHLDLVRALGIVRTPTTIVLDARGGEVTRAAGAPTKAQVLTALAKVVT